MATCGRCDRLGCEPYFVWDPINQVRLLMCAELVKGFAHVYGEGHTLPLVLADKFSGVYCDECEEDVAGERAPGVRVGDAVLCRTCTLALDERVLRNGLEERVGGVVVDPRAWAVVRLETDMSMRETKCEFNRTYKKNMAVIEDLRHLLAQLRLTEDPLPQK